LRKAEANFDSEKNSERFNKGRALSMCSMWGREGGCGRVGFLNPLGIMVKEEESVTW